jgi:hypothetical protein
MVNGAHAAMVRVSAHCARARGMEKRVCGCPVMVIVPSTRPAGPPSTSPMDTRYTPGVTTCSPSADTRAATVGGRVKYTVTVAPGARAATRWKSKSSCTGSPGCPDEKNASADTSLRGGGRLEALA